MYYTYPCQLKLATYSSVQNRSAGLKNRAGGKILRSKKVTTMKNSRDQSMCMVEYTCRRESFLKINKRADQNKTMQGGFFSQN